MEPMAKWEHAKIVSAMYGKEDHGILTCMLMMEWKSAGQGFGLVVLDPERTGPSFVKEICSLFVNAKTVDELIGRSCEIGWRFGEWGEQIEAIKTPFGEFQINEWRQRMWPGTPSLVEQRRKRLSEEAGRAQQRAREAREELTRFVDENYHGDD